MISFLQMRWLWLLVTLITTVYAGSVFPDEDKYRSDRETMQIYRAWDDANGIYRLSLNRAELENELNKNLGERRDSRFSLGYYEPQETKENLTPLGRCDALLKKTLYRYKSGKPVSEITEDYRDPNDWTNKGSFYCAPTFGYCGAYVELRSVERLDGTLEYSADLQEVYEWNKQTDKYKSGSELVCFTWRSFAMRMDLLAYDNQIYRAYSYANHSMRVATRLSDIQSFVDNKQLQLLYPVGWYISMDQSRAALARCPRLVQKNLYWWDYPPNGPVSDFAGTKDSKWKLMGTFLCSPEAGYCEAEKAMKLIYSQGQGGDYFWTSSGVDVDAMLKDPYYQPRVIRTECWVW